ncbi:MFS transporter [Nonomuraea sp. K274]|uniref:MFS transporter n=2 Tax=Nonomuraea cypriaca TaxID=1187855 RepID=A0A931EZY3_9ACTN|nr:MFS transporter [Nonomuraea cypriaca]
MASYLDAGSISAVSTGLTLFRTEFGLSEGMVGLLAALGPNAIGCGLGAFVGGRLGDKLGRKRIYQWDLLVFAAGMLLVALSIHPAMLLAGTFVAGLAVGADVPTSLALVGELAPAKARGKLLGLTQIAWVLGPSVVLALAYALDPLGLLGVRIVFLHLVVVALITWAMRRGMTESAVWRAASETTLASARQLRALLSGPNLRALAYTGIFYTFWNLAAGTIGAFTPYLVETLGAGGRDVSILTTLIGLLFGVPTLLVVMRFIDRGTSSRRVMMGIGSVLGIISYGMFLFTPYGLVAAQLSIVLWAVSSKLAGELSYKTFSQELFPTMLRGTAQGLTFGVARILLGVWSFAVPAIAGAGITGVATALTLFVVVSGVVGFFFMPDTAGRPLEEIEAERAGVTSQRRSAR